LDYNICDTNSLLPLGYLSSYCIPENVYNDIIIKGKPYTCLCERKFRNRNVFENHIDGKCLGKEGESRKKELRSKFRTIEGNQYQCMHQDCNQNFKSIPSLNQHHQTDHLKDIVCPYKCAKCKQTFFLKVLLNSHCRKIHFEDVQEVCKICGQDMKTPMKLRLHLKSHNDYKSSVDTGTQKTLELETHDIASSRDATLDVVDASNIFAGKKVKRTVKRKQPRVTLEPAKVQAPDIPERYPCGKKRYKPVGYYPEYSISKERYIDIISSGKPYICACQKQFVHRHTFERHLYGNCLGKNGENKRQELHAKWKKDENGTFHCIFPGCSEKFKYNLSLYSHHQKEHLNGVECPFKCNQCDKSFFLRSLLNCHVKDTHEKRSSQNSQVCDICGKDVIRNQMKLHMMRHTGEKPFQCGYCEYRGLTNSAVLQHVKHVHEPHKFTLHFCDMCGKDCKTKAHLKEHILTHSDKRTFLCKICGKYLKNRNSFGRHMVRVHKVSHRCTHCGVDYFTLQGLQIHLLKAHNITS
jgi:KRAB domain-containing zinc finger protein